jgi:hypothetical protein
MNWEMLAALGQLAAALHESAEFTYNLSELMKQSNR